MPTPIYAFFKIACQCPLQGHPPGHIVHLAVDEDGTPMDIFWRKRRRDGDIEPHDPHASSASSPKSGSKKGA